MRHLSLAVVACILITAPAKAQMPAPSRETIPAPIQTGAFDLLEGAPDREIWHLDNKLIAVRNVTKPTLTPFLPVGQPGGPAVIVAPGGGFLGLAIEKEGWQVARWLANHGIAAFVLKYRVLHTPDSQSEFAEKLARALKGEKVDMPSPPHDTPPEALADGLAAIRYVRAHAASYGIDPTRVGVMGFSAGGVLSRSIVEHAGKDMPAFIAPIYPTMTAITAPDNAPPMFVAVAADDFLLAEAGGPFLIDSYRKAGKSVEFHMFAAGGHGFGPGAPGAPTENWLESFSRWLRTTGLLRH